MSKFKNYIIKKLGGTTLQQYNLLQRKVDRLQCERSDLEADYSSLRDENAKLLINYENIKAKFCSMNIKPLRFEITVGNPHVLNVDGKQVKSFVKRETALQLGDYLVENGFVTIKPQYNAHGNLTYTAYIDVVKYEKENEDESNRACQTNRRSR